MLSCARRNRLIYGLCWSVLLGFSNSSYSDFDFDPYCSSNFFIPNIITLSAGPIWTKVGSRTQTMFLTPTIVKTYTSDKIIHNMPEGEIFLGSQTNLYDQLFGQLGIAFSFAGNARRSGTIWDDADPEFDNYIYSYLISHMDLTLKGKLLIDDLYWFTPWISGSIGAGLNRSYSFKSAPTIFEAVPTPPFRSYKQVSFTYKLGVGVQLPLSSCWQLGVSYEFADWGKNILGRAIGQSTKARLGSNHVYTNGIIFNISYLF